MQYQQAYTNKTNSKQNGRVDIIGPTVEQQFELYDKIKNGSEKSTFFDAVTGQWENTPLSNAFFSGNNIMIIQNALRAGVHSASKGEYLICPQDEDNLKMIMRSIYLQNSKNNMTNIPSQIEKLNKIIVDMFVPKICNEAKAYLIYKRDASTMYTLMDHPIHSAISDKTLELKSWF